ncbi:hypothetical protein L1887_17779 [Cichorium endivia]|nr:hypothetical protein L1887_17779 [Cichorium endivia]
MLQITPLDLQSTSSPASPSPASHSFASSAHRDGFGDNVPGALGRSKMISSPNLGHERLSTARLLSRAFASLRTRVVVVIPITRGNHDKIVWFSIRPPSGNHLKEPEALHLEEKSYNLTNLNRLRPLHLNFGYQFGLITTELGHVRILLIRMEENIQKLTPRLSIDKLRSIIGNLNDTQKRDVKAMGFGDLLEMNEIELPLKLASALFHYYDPKSSSIQIISTELKITEETDLTITKESVHAVFGFPMRMVQVELPEKTSKHVSKDDSITCNWQKQFKDKVDQYHKITVDMVFNMMASQHSGGLEFKQNFLVCVLTILGTGPQTGFVDQYCLHKLDADRISQTDWCTYILNALNKRRKEWTPTDRIKQNFVVPLALLVVSKLKTLCNVLLPLLSYSL